MLVNFGSLNNFRIYFNKSTYGPQIPCRWRPKKIVLTPCSVSLCGVWIRAVLACTESNSAQIKFSNSRSDSLCGVWLCVVLACADSDSAQCYFANISAKQGPMWVTKFHRKKDKKVSWYCHFKVLEQKGYYWSSLVIKTDFFAQKDVIYSTCLQSGCTPQEELRIRKRFYLQNHLACLLHRGLGGFYNWNIKNNKRSSYTADQKHMKVMCGWCLWYWV